MGRISALQIQKRANGLLDELQNTSSQKECGSIAQDLLTALDELLALNQETARKALAKISIAVFQAATALLKGSSALQSCPEHTISLATKALDCLYNVRALLKGSKAYVEFQHYSLLRSMLTLKLHPQALAEGANLLNRLHHLLDKTSSLHPSGHGHAQPNQDSPKETTSRVHASRQTSKQTSASQARELEEQCLPVFSFPRLPEGDAGDLSGEIASVVVGTFLTLLIALAEVPPTKQVKDQAHSLSQASPGLQKWLQLLSTSEASKQQDTLFRCWYKVVQVLLPLCDAEEATIALSLFGTLCSACLKSASASKLPQVVAKAGIPQSSLLEFLSEAFNQIQMQSSPQEHLLGFSEYVVSCSSGSISDVIHLLHTVAHRKGGELVGIYAAGLHLRQAPLDGSNEDVLRSLQAATKALEPFWRSEGIADGTKAHLRQPILRALNFLRKSLPKEGIANVLPGASNADQVHKHISGLMWAFAAIMKVCVTEETLRTKFSYPSASAYALALTYSCRQWTGEVSNTGMSTMDQKDAESCTAADFAGLLSFYHSPREVLAPEELLWLLSKVQTETENLSETNLHQEAVVIQLACFHATVSLLGHCEMSFQAKESEAADLCATVCVCAAESFCQTKDYSTAQEVCRMAGECLVRSFEGGYQSIRLVLAFLFQPGCRVSAAGVVEAILAASDGSVRQSIMREVAQAVFTARLQQNTGAELDDCQAGLPPRILEVMEQACQEDTASRVQLLHLQAALCTDKQSTACLLQALSLAEELKDSDGTQLELEGTCHALLALNKARSAQNLGEGKEELDTDGSPLEIWVEIETHTKTACKLWAQSAENTASRRPGLAKQTEKDPSQLEFLEFVAEQLAGLSGLQFWSCKEQLLDLAQNFWHQRTGTPEEDFSPNIRLPGGMQYLLSCLHGGFQNGVDIQAGVNNGAGIDPGRGWAGNGGCGERMRCRDNALDRAKTFRDLAFKLQRLAASGISDCAVIAERAYYHHLASQYFHQGGNICEALYDAEETLRLAGGLSASTSSAAPFEARLLGISDSTESLGSWSAKGLYLASLAQTGILWEKIGSPTEAVLCLKEGSELAAAIGCELLHRLFLVHLARLEIKCGREPQASEVLEKLSQPLTIFEGAEWVESCLRIESQVIAAIHAAKFGSIEACQSYLHKAEAELAHAHPTIDAVKVCQLRCEIGLLQADLYWRSQRNQEALSALQIATQSCHPSSGLVQEHARVELLRCKIAIETANPKPRGFIGGACLLVASPELSARSTAASGGTRDDAVKQTNRRADEKGKLARNRSGGRQVGGKQKDQQQRSLQELQEVLWRLIELVIAVQQLPLLLSQVSHLIMHMSCALGLPWTAAYFLQLSHGASISLQVEAIQCSKFQTIMKQRFREEREHDNDNLLDAEFYPLSPFLDLRELEDLVRERSLAALEEEAKKRLVGSLRKVPEQCKVCSIKADRERWWQDTGDKDMLVISICQADSYPILLAVKSSTDSTNGLVSCTAILDRILQESAVSMTEDHPGENIESRRSWWRKRQSLDLDTAHLLTTMETKLLGPWRYLFLGNSAGRSACKDVAERVDAALSKCRQSQRRRSADLLSIVVEIMDVVPKPDLEQIFALIASSYGDDVSPDRLEELVSQQRGSLKEEEDSDGHSTVLMESNAALRSTTTAKARKGETAGKPGRAARNAKTALKPSHSQAAPLGELGGPKPKRLELRFNLDSNPPETERLRGRDQSIPRKTLFAVDDKDEQDKGVPSTPRRERDLPSADAFKTPGANLGKTTARRTVRKTGLMNRMRQAPGGLDAVDSPLPPQTSRQATRQSRFAPATQAKKLNEESKRANPTDHVSETESDGEPELQGFTLHRGAASSMSELSSRMRGLALEQEEAAPNEAPDVSRGPLLLILDSATQSLPWESMSSLRNQNIWRVPSLHWAASTAASTASAVNSSGDASSESDGETGSEFSAVPTVDVAATFYLLNPGGDLQPTQAMFEPMFQRQTTWRGWAGEVCDQEELLQLLGEREMFIYLGHGCGQQYVSARTLRQRLGLQKPHSSAAFVMGCSSGKLAALGEYESYGFILAYMLAGCSGAVANLWDVTDRDIDRFTRAVIDSWLEHSESEGAEGGYNGAIRLSIATSKDKCRLPHLIGAAPVCYGLPLSLKPTRLRSV